MVGFGLWRVYHRFVTKSYDIPKRFRGRPVKYSEEFKGAIFTELENPSNTIHDVALRYRVPESTIKSWLKKMSPAALNSAPGELSETSEADSTEFTASVTPSASAGGK